MISIEIKILEEKEGELTLFQSGLHKYSGVREGREGEVYESEKFWQKVFGIYRSCVEITNQEFHP